jgi:hypothetical protein
MPGQNATAQLGGEPWYKLFDALQYVTNPYALLGFLFLIAVVGIGFTDMRDRLRGFSLIGLALLIVLTTGLLLRESLGKVAEASLVHLANDPDQQSAEVAQGVRVRLVDTTSLEGKPDQGRRMSGMEFNRTLPPYVPAEVFERANVDPIPPDRFAKLSQAEWDAYLDGLGEAEADAVKDIPFARLRIWVDGKEAAAVSGRWWFKGQTVEVPGADGRPVRFKLANIYNTKNRTSGEPEAINLQLLPPPA